MRPVRDFRVYMKMVAYIIEKKEDAISTIIDTEKVVQVNQPIYKNELLLGL